jgi:hypothetical protein
VASERLGHSQISVTADLYTHVNESVGRAAAEKIAGALKASTKTVPAASLQQTPENSPQQGGNSEHIGERARPPPAFPLVRGLDRLSQQSAPGGIRTPNLLIRKQSGPYPGHVGIWPNRP